MQLVYMLVFLLLMCGFVDLLKIRLSDVVEPPDKQNTTAMTKAETGKKKKRFSFTMHRIRMETTFRSLGSSMTWEKYLKIACVCACVGASVGAACDNMFLAVVLGVASLIVPSFYFEFRQRSYEKHLHDQMQSAVAIITNSYVMYFDVNRAVDEALKTADEPFRSVLTHFVSRVSTNVSVKEALRELRPMVNDHYWREWIDLMIQCQTNSSLNEMLLPIPNTMSKQSQMQARWDTESQKIWLEHLLFAGLSLGSIFLVLMLNKDWGDILLYHPIGKAVVALNVLMVFISTLYAYKVNRPIYAEV